VKTYHASTFANLGFRFQPAEEFYSVSRKNVLRGMHFHMPPYDHEKLVYCISGRVLDVLLDLRLDSATFGRYTSAELSAENRLQYLIPKGIAHGFYTLSENSIMIYKTSTLHVPSHDSGILWNSFGFNWGFETPIVSERDAKLPAMDKFISPF
jgi:dTDP-4-dehydrorhamnose 3,5-epimerase